MSTGSESTESGPSDSGTIFTGTSGYSYKEWKGSFYPDDMGPKKFLEFYSGKLTTVEINNTFYRFPKASMLEEWRDKTPDHFRFAVKAHTKISHRSRLEDVEEFTADFVERCQTLAPKLGPILIQLPPWLKRDDDRLGAFLKCLPQGTRYAFEFRSETWFEDEVLRMLEDARVALCVSEGDKLDTPKVATADYCYARLRKDEYGEEELRAWRTWFEEQAGAGRDVYVYIKHDDAGVSPLKALSLLQGN